MLFKMFSELDPEFKHVIDENDIFKIDELVDSGRIINGLEILYAMISNAKNPRDRSSDEYTAIEYILRIYETNPDNVSLFYTDKGQEKSILEIFKFINMNTDDSLIHYANSCDYSETFRPVNWRVDFSSIILKDKNFIGFVKIYDIFDILIKFLNINPTNIKYAVGLESFIELFVNDICGLIFFGLIEFANKDHIVFRVTNLIFSYITKDIVNIKDSNGYTALMKAAESGNNYIFEKLMNMGADIFETNKNKSITFYIKKSNILTNFQQKHEIYKIARKYNKDINIHLSFFKSVLYRCI